MHPTLRSPLRPASIAALALAFAAAGCRANYAPTSPITGVDRPYPERPQARQVDLGPELFNEFMADLLDERELTDVDPSYAVFPAFSRNRDVGASVNGMGTYLAEETTRLIEVGVPNALVVTGDTLLGELGRAGIDPGSLCSVDDVLQAAPQLDVSYLVYGTVNHTTENALEGRHSVAVSWSCLRVDDGRLTARIDEAAIRGEAAMPFIGMMGRPTNWDICK